LVSVFKAHTGIWFNKDYAYVLTYLPTHLLTYLFTDYKLLDNNIMYTFATLSLIQHLTFSGDQLHFPIGLFCCL